MPSTAEQFASTPELLSCLGRVVVNRELLRHLCLTSKSFNASFTPFLYAEVWIRASNARFLVENLQVLLDNSSLRYTKKFDVAIPRHSRKDTGHTEGALSELYNEGVQALLGSMPDLTYFSWEDVTLYTSTISTLHQKCPKLRSLIIHNEEHIEERLGLMDDFDFNDGFHERRALFGTQDLSLFSELTELEVYGIYGDINRARKDLAKLLYKSPKLKKLGLSLSADAVERLNFEGETAKDIEYLLFLKTLCDDYAAAGGTPLNIEKIVFGLGLILWEPGSFLSSLVDLESLEDAYISNQGHDVAIYFQEEDGLGWNLFTPNKCPNLSTFGVYDLTKSVKRWIDTLEPGYLQQFRTERAVEDDLSDVVLKLEGTNTSSKSKMSMLICETDFFQNVEIRGIQALAINIGISFTTEQAFFFEWVQKATALEQLLLNIPSMTSASDQPAEDSFEHQVATVCKKLRYMKLNNVAWRIRRGEDGKKIMIRFEKLDRFESRGIEVFQPWSVFVV